MAPSAAKLKEALAQGTRDVFKAHPDEVSVNKVRRHVEEKLGLDDGFFAEGKWKQMSKAVIKEHVDILLDAAEVGSAQEVAAGAKRRSPKTTSPQAKRQKKASAPLRKNVEEEEEEEEDEEEETDASEAEKPKSMSKPKPKSRAPPKQLAKSKAKTGSPHAREDDSEDEAEGKKRSSKTQNEVKKPAPRRPKAASVSESDGQSEDAQVSSELSELSEFESMKDSPDLGGSDEEDLETSKGDAKPTNGNAKALAKEHSPADEDDKDPESAAQEEDEYSDVIDAPAPPKSRKKGSAKNASTAAPKTAKAPRKTKSSAPDDSDEAEIKKLQSQLVKCGIRKLWHNELRQYGGDARAKIRHLRKMLADAGMDGRFSEAKAREIRELRELRADVEAAQEMNKLWGVASGTRASRAAKSKSVSQSAQMDVDRESDAGGEEEDGGGEEDGEGVEGDGDEEDEDMSFAARRRRAHADLAFLGDESDSE